jgi:hypothetical protein
LAEIAQICVVHLVRQANGTAPLRSFLESYGRHPAGVDHSLLLLFKGFEQPPPAEYEALLKGVAHQRRFIPDRGFDVDAYFRIAQTHEADVFCFLNSFSVILADGWLACLHRALVERDAGLVGVTGSWQSISLNSSDAPHAPWPARPGYPAWRRKLLKWFPFLPGLVRTARWHLLRGMFDRFPNYHLRTNAFMIRRVTALKLHVAAMRRKFDAYRFESGRQGMTRQVLEMGNTVLIVGRDGKAYDMQDWHLSNTFWRRNQGNLLVADNQTRAYDTASDDDRAMYSGLAWGPEADAGRDPGRVT